MLVGEKREGWKKVGLNKAANALFWRGCMLIY